ncbi:MAG: MBL fold metallo-hydrolase [Syntrophales bacterium]
MKITDRIHAIRHSFRLSLGEGKFAERFVYSYLIVGKTICLVDAGVAATAPLIIDAIKEMGRSPREISLILLTHAHPDHIGGCAPIRKLAPAPIAVHATEKRWVEDVELQYRERPVPNLFELVPVGAPVDRVLTDGETISWEEGTTVRVIATPGHSSGSVSFLFAEEGALFSGDSLPAAGHIPIYADPVALRASVEKLKRLTGVKVLFSSWHEPIVGERIAETMEEASRYIGQVDALVREIDAQEPNLSGEELSRRALERLGISMHRILPMVEASFKSHLR